MIYGTECYSHSLEKKIYFISANNNHWRIFWQIILANKINSNTLSNITILYNIPIFYICNKEMSAYMVSQ
jgi:hypothetical protein